MGKIAWKCRRIAIFFIILHSKIEDVRQSIGWLALFFCKLNKQKLVPSCEILHSKMNVNRKRHIASWLLLAVFVPMLILSSLHVHEQVQDNILDCKECVDHHCHGHLTQLSMSMDDCVLCQFLMLTFLAEAALVVVFYNRTFVFHFAQPQCDVHLEALGIPTLRAPPTVWISFWVKEISRLCGWFGK